MKKQFKFNKKRGQQIQNNKLTYITVKTAEQEKQIQKSLNRLLIA